MSNSLLELERATLERLRGDFEAKGYRFVSHPSQADTPEFLGDHRPDAVAFGERDHVVIEVKGPRPRGNRIPLAEVAQAVGRHPGWRYLLVYAEQDGGETVDLPRPSKPGVDDAIAEARELLGAGHARAALLEAWAILEALSRRTSPESPTSSAKSQSPAQIVERLAMDGALDAAESRRFRSLISLRNAVAHGDLEATVSAEDVDCMLTVAATINSRPAAE